MRTTQEDGSSNYMVRTNPWKWVKIILSAITALGTLVAACLAYVVYYESHSASINIPNFTIKTYYSRYIDAVNGVCDNIIIDNNCIFSRFLVHVDNKFEIVNTGNTKIKDIVVEFLINNDIIDSINKILRNRRINFTFNIDEYSIKTMDSELIEKKLIIRNTDYKKDFCRYTFMSEKLMKIDNAFLDKGERVRFSVPRDLNFLVNTLYYISRFKEDEDIKNILKKGIPIYISFSNTKNEKKNLFFTLYLFGLLMGNDDNLLCAGGVEVKVLPKKQ